MASGNYNPFRFLDPASQRTTGRGGSGTSVGGQTFLGAAPVPQSTAPAGGTRLATSRRRSFLPQGSLVTGTGFSGSMGRRQPVQSIGQRTPTFTNSQAFYNARGSDLDRLERYGPDRSSQDTGLGAVTYGGRSVGAPSMTNAEGTRTRVGNQVIDFSTGQNLDASNPYTSLTGDTGSAQVMDSTPPGRYNRMAAEQAALAAEGLEVGRAAAAQVREVQNAVEAPALTQSATPTGTGRIGLGRYGVGTVYPSGGGPSKSFGRFNSPTVEADRQAEIGERAIASRAKRLAASKDRLNRYSR